VWLSWRQEQTEGEPEEVEGAYRKGEEPFESRSVLFAFFKLSDFFGLPNFLFGAGSGGFAEEKWRG
jgi:hypothetical protein